MNIKDSTKLVQNADIIDSQIDDEVVMMDVEKGAYFGMNPVGSVIWENLASPQTIDELVTKLTDEYDISIKDCKAEVLPFVEQLSKINLLVEVG